MNAFESWWHNIGSGLAPAPSEDQETHARRVCAEAWAAAIDKAASCVYLDGNPANAIIRIARLKETAAKPPA